MEATQLFNKIIEELVALLETNLQLGKYIGQDFDSEVTQEIRDAELAIELLKPFKDKAACAVPVLTRLLTAPIHWWLPATAAEALGGIGIAAEAAIPQLAQLMLSDEAAPQSNFGEYAATNALGDIGSDKAVPYLMLAAPNPDEQSVGWRAIIALSTLGVKAKDALPLLKHLRSKTEFQEIWKTIDEAITSITEDMSKQDLSLDLMNDLKN